MARVTVRRERRTAQIAVGDHLSGIDGPTNAHYEQGLWWRTICISTGGSESFGRVKTEASSYATVPYADVHLDASASASPS